MEAMKIFDHILREYFPKRYIRRGIERTQRELEAKLKTTPAKDRYELESYYHQCEFRQWDDWLTTIEDAEMVEKAKKMDIYLDDFPFPDIAEGECGAEKKQPLSYKRIW